jgi:hypothetical protein
MCNNYINLPFVLLASKLEIWGGIQAEASNINIICRTALQSWSLFPLGKAIMINFVTLRNPLQLSPPKQGMGEGVPISLPDLLFLHTKYEQS